MKITLQDWAERNYSPTPSIRILRGWVSSGEIMPPPEKVGRIWMVDERATRMPLAVAADMSTMSARAQRILKLAA